MFCRRNFHQGNFLKKAYILAVKVLDESLNFLLYIFRNTLPKFRFLPIYLLSSIFTHNRMSYLKKLDHQKNNHRKVS